MSSLIEPLMTYRCIIADDEPLARARLRQLLDAEPDFVVAAECENGEEAVQAIRSLQPDIVFLDVQMPVLDGFGVVDRIGSERMPLTVFVTAFDQHALRAFEAHARDYLLKPFDQGRFQRTLQWIRASPVQPSAVALEERLLRLVRSLEPPPSPYREKLVVRSGSRLIIVAVADVDWIASEGNYLRIHVGAKSYLLRETMNALEVLLDPREFVRIHRSTIVRIRNIRELESVFQGEYLVVLQDGTRLSSSRAYRQALERAVSITS